MAAINSITRWLVYVFVAFMAACGGGGGSASDAQAADLPPPLPFTLVVDGDSLAAASTWPDAYQGRINTAQSGSQLTDVLNRWDSTVFPYSPIQTGKPALYILVIGTNDCRHLTDNIEVIWYRLKAVWAKAKNAGFRVMAATVASSANAFAPTTQADAEACRVDLNARIRARSDLYDRLLELDRMFPDTTDASMLYDGIHFTGSANARVAVETARLIDSL